LVLFLFSLISILGIILFIQTIGVQSVLADISSKRFLDTGEGYKASLGYYRLMASFIEPAFYIYMLYFIIRRKRLLSASGVLLVFLALFSLFFPIFTSSRTGVMFFFVNCLIILSLTRKLSFHFFGVIIVIAGVLFSGVTTLRSS